MRLVALTRTRFDGDIIEESVRHNLQFVDRVYVSNNLSPDSTLETLLALQTEGLPLTVWEDDVLGGMEEVMTDLARRTFQEDEADYLMIVDPDEFLKAPSREDLELALAALPPDVHGLIPWATYVPTVRDSDDDRLLARIAYRRASETLPYYKVILSRAFMKFPNAKIANGSHGVTHTEEPAETKSLQDVRLAHFPVRSIAQLRGKALLGWSSWLIAGYDEEGGLAYQWRRLYDELQKNADWSATDLYYFALTYLGEERGAPDLVHDPIRPVERRYVQPIPNLDAVAAAFTRQVIEYCVNLKWERSRLQAEASG